MNGSDCTGGSSVDCFVNKYYEWCRVRRVVVMQYSALDGYHSATSRRRARNKELPYDPASNCWGKAGVDAFQLGGSSSFGLFLIAGETTGRSEGSPHAPSVFPWCQLKIIRITLPLQHKRIHTKSKPKPHTNNLPHSSIIQQGLDYHCLLHHNWRYTRFASLCIYLFTSTYDRHPVSTPQYEKTAEASLSVWPVGRSTNRGGWTFRNSNTSFFYHGFIRWSSCFTGVSTHVFGEFWWSTKVAFISGFVVCIYLESLTRLFLLNNEIRANEGSRHPLNQE
jgi:hypothetical protein